MIASLYHSGSASAAEAAASAALGRGWPTFISACLEPPDTERLLRRIEPNMLILAIPHEIVPAHQIRHRNRGLIPQAELPERHLDRRLLRDVGIEADGHQDHAAIKRITFSVQNDLVVEGIVKCQPEMGLQRRMPPPD